MRDQISIYREVDTLFQHCKQLLEERPVRQHEFVEALFQLNDFRSELAKMIGEREAHTIILMAYQEVFPGEKRDPVRTNDEIINDIALCYRRARKLLFPQKALVLICMIILIERYEKELRANIGPAQAHLMVAFLCRTEFLVNYSGF